MSYNNKIDPRITNWTVRHLKNVEILAVFVVGLSITLRASGIFAGDVVVTLVLSAQSIFYFLRAYYLFDFLTPMQNFFQKIMSWSWAIGIIGILFVFQNWGNSSQMLMTGVFTQVLSVIGLVIFIMKERDVEFIIENEQTAKIDQALNKKSILRSLIFILLSILLLLGSKETLQKTYILRTPVEQTNDR